MSQSFKTQKKKADAKQPRKFKKPSTKRLLVYTILALFITSSILLAASLYQVQVESPSEQDYHMNIPEGKYEWHSRNVIATWLGVACFFVGVVAVAIFLSTQSLKPNKG